MSSSKPGPTGYLAANTKLADRYLILSPLGSGGMGTVYKARDLRFPSVTKLVAVKVLLNQTPDLRMRQVIARNFEREANTLATLAHPAIPHILDFFSEQDRSYLVQEFIEGKDLERVLSERSDFLPWNQVLEWAVALCEVLMYLHAYKPQPIIFRDMKPSNVMLDNHGRIRLIDFGIARGFEANQKGTIIGTEGYSPPEQYRGLASPVGDLYALGATMHHLLTRRDPRLEAPFSFGDRPIRSINPDVPEPLEAVINKALEYDAAKRFPSARAMREALLLVGARTGGTAAIDDASALPAPQSPGRPAGAGATAQINTSTSMLTGRRPVPKPSHPTPPTATSHFVGDQGGQSHLEGGIVPVWSFYCEDEIRSTPALSDDMVFVSAYDHNIYALGLLDGAFKWKFAAEGGFAASPTVSERQVLTGSEDQKVYALNAETGKRRWVFDTDGPVRGTAAVGSGHAFIGSDDGYLYAINLARGNMLWRFEAEAPVRSRPLVDEANGLVYFGDEEGRFFAVDFGGERKWQFRAKRGFTASPVASDGIIFVGSRDGFMYGLDIENGWPVWRFRAMKAIVSTAAVDEKLRVFFGSADHHIYALDGGSGRLMWQFETGDQVASSPALHDEHLYVGSVDGNLYCLETRKGSVEWQFSTKAPVISSPVIRDELLFFGSTDNSLYALLI